MNKKAERRISKILKKEPNQRTREELIELAYFKKETRQKISYEEYVLMLSTGDELTFEYKDSIYENVHGLQPNTIHFCMTTYKDSIEIEQKYEIYKSIEEMLENVRISGKTIKEIWKDVIF